jgi:putative MATE family efflux protein
LAVALEQPQTIDLRIERLNRTIVNLALPSVLESVLTTMVYFVDTILIARLNDPVSLAAVGLSSTLMWAADGLFQAISVSASAMVARFWGQRDFESARRVAGQALILSVLVAFVLMSLLIPVARPFLRLMGAEAAVVDNGAQYVYILLATSVVSFPLSVANSIMRATGDTRKPMYITALMNACNMVAAYALIFGTEGIPILSTIPLLGAIPSLGVRGAALATSAARTLGGGVALAILFSGRTPIHLRLSHLRRLDLRLIWRMIHISLPNIGETLISRLGFMLYSRILSELGTVAVAAHQIALRVESLAFMPGWGMATAAAALVGQALGANKEDVAERGIQRTLLLGNGTMALIGAGFVFFAPQIVSLFGVQHAEMAQMAITVVRIGALELFGLCSVMILGGCLRGAGDTRTPMIVTTAGTFLFRVPITYLFALALGGGLRGLWLGTAVDWSMRSLIMLVLYRRGKWKTVEV